MPSKHKTPGGPLSDKPPPSDPNVIAEQERSIAAKLDAHRKTLAALRPGDGGAIETPPEPALNKPRGRQKRRVREALMFPIWRLVKEHMARSGSKNVSKACREIFEQFPRGLNLVASGEKRGRWNDDSLRKVYYEAERARKQPDQHPNLALRMKQVEESCRTLQQRMLSIEAVSTKKPI